MNQNIHSTLVGFIWKIADLLRSPYHPPQYRRVLPPKIVLRRMDCVPEDTKDLVLAELIPLPADIPLPLPLDYDSKADNSYLVNLVRINCEDYMMKEVLPHVKDAWIDYSKTKVGYEIPINRHFYVCEPPRDLSEIEEEMQHCLKEIV